MLVKGAPGVKNHIKCNMLSSGHYWDQYPDTHPIILVDYHHPFEDQAPLD